MLIGLIDELFESHLSVIMPLCLYALINLPSLESWLSFLRDQEMFRCYYMHGFWKVWICSIWILNLLSSETCSATQWNSMCVCVRACVCVLLCVYVWALLTLTYSAWVPLRIEQSRVEALNVTSPFDCVWGSSVPTFLYDKLFLWFRLRVCSDEAELGVPWNPVDGGHPGLLWSTPSSLPLQWT